MLGNGGPAQRLQQIATGLVALGAIGLAVWEGHENRLHNRLSVVPKVDAYRNFDMHAQRFELGLASNGLGPAVVRGLQLYLDGEPIHDGGADEESAWFGAAALFERLRGFDIIDAYYPAGHFLVPGERYQLLGIERRAGTAPLGDFRELANRIDVVVCYCSVYADQCAAEHVGVGDVTGDCTAP